MSTTYVPVVPREHDAACERGVSPTSARYGLDRDHCERCRNLWARLDECAARRRQRSQDAA